MEDESNAPASMQSEDTAEETKSESIDSDNGSVKEADDEDDDGEDGEEAVTVKEKGHALVFDEAHVEEDSQSSDDDADAELDTTDTQQHLVDGVSVLLREKFPGEDFPEWVAGLEARLSTVAEHVSSLHMTNMPSAFGDDEETLNMQTELLRLKEFYRVGEKFMDSQPDSYTDEEAQTIVQMHGTFTDCDNSVNNQQRAGSILRRATKECERLFALLENLAGDLEDEKDKAAEELAERERRSLKKLKLKTGLSEAELIASGKALQERSTAASAAFEKAVKRAEAWASSVMKDRLSLINHVRRFLSVFAEALRFAKDTRREIVSFNDILNAVFQIFDARSASAVRDSSTLKKLCDIASRAHKVHPHLGAHVSLMYTRIPESARADEMAKESLFGEVLLVHLQKYEFITLASLLATRDATSHIESFFVNMHHYGIDPGSRFLNFMALVQRCVKQEEPKSKAARLEKMKGESKKAILTKIFPVVTDISVILLNTFEFRTIGPYEFEYCVRSSRIKNNRFDRRKGDEEMFDTHQEGEVPDSDDEADDDHAADDHGVFRVVKVHCRVHSANERFITTFNDREHKRNIVHLFSAIDVALHPRSRKDLDQRTASFESVLLGAKFSPVEWFAVVCVLYRLFRGRVKGEWLKRLLGPVPKDFDPYARIRLPDSCNENRDSSPFSHVAQPDILETRKAQLVGRPLRGADLFRAIDAIPGDTTSSSSANSSSSVPLLRREAAGFFDLLSRIVI